MPPYKPTKRKMPYPFLKWVGGKRQLLPELRKRVEAAGAIGRYHEPFIGGGALFFDLACADKLGKKHAYLSDSNRNLIDAYRGVKQDVDAVIELLKKHKEKHCKEYYYDVRTNVPDGLNERTARIIYLNRTCFNGLFRENSKGLFNVPIGDYKKPKICDEPNLRAVSEALEKAKLEARPFETILKKAKPGDFVYFDPPYHPVSKTASFTAYQKGGFGEEHQRKLAEVYCELDKMGVKVLLSNSYTPLIHDLYKYKQFSIDTVKATRRVNSRSDRRGRVKEALVRNF